jgi:phage tail sheath gpL-like
MPIKRPEASFTIIPAAQLAGVQEQKALIVGQMLAGGSATGGELQQDIGNNGEEDALFGQNSHIAGMCRAFKRENKISQLDALPLDDAAGTQATGEIAFTGPATEDGTLNISIGSETDHRYTLDIISGDSATDIGDLLAAAVTADGDAPFSAANVTGTVTATAENDGTLANDWGIKIEGTVAGVGATITAWAGGATDPTLTGILDVIANIRYQTIIWPSAYALTVLQTELDARFNVTNNILDGVGVQILVDTLTNLKSAVASLNSQSLVIAGQKPVDLADRKGPATFEMPDIMAAEIGAIRALRLTENANISQYVSTTATADQRGGIGIASLPYANTALPNLPIADPVDEFSVEDLQELTDNAVATFGPNSAFNGAIMGEFVTTYLTDAAANADDSYKFLNTVDTASVIREFFFTNFKSRYAQTRLTNGDLLPGRDMANASSIRAFCNQLYDELANTALTQLGAAAKKDYNDNLSISLSLSTGTATVDMAPLLVTQLRVIIGTIQINFGGN